MLQNINPTYCNPLEVKALENSQALLLREAGAVDFQGLSRHEASQGCLRKGSQNTSGDSSANRQIPARKGETYRVYRHRAKPALPTRLGFSKPLLSSRLWEQALSRLRRAPEHAAAPGTAAPFLQATQPAARQRRNGELRLQHCWLGAARYPPTRRFSAQKRDPA